MQKSYALSRRKPGFESRYRYHDPKNPNLQDFLGFVP